MRSTMKGSSVIMEVHHSTGVNAANTVNLKQRKAIDCNSLLIPKLDHQKAPQGKLITTCGSREDL